MGAAYSRSRKTVDTRQPNLGTSGLPAELELVVSLEDEVLGTLGIPQNAKLSENGNVTYNGGIQGWVLEGDFDGTLRSIAISAAGTVLTTSSAGVHQSQHGNPQVFMTGSVSLPVAGSDEDRRYQVKVYVTHSPKKGTYSISAKAFPLPKTSGPRAPVVRGTLSGAFVLASSAKAA